MSKEYPKIVLLQLCYIFLELRLSDPKLPGLDLWWTTVMFRGTKVNF